VLPLSFARRRPRIYSRRSALQKTRNPKLYYNHSRTQPPMAKAKTEEE